MDAATSTRGGGIEPIGPILARCMRSWGLLRPTRQRRLARAWCEAVGPETARHTRILSFRRGVLEVAVDSAARLQELVCFEKSAILDRLRQNLGSMYVRDIRFRPGGTGMG